MPITGEANTDLHEVFITRGMVMKSEHKDKIYDRRNCILRHHACPIGKGQHYPGTGSEEEYRACLMAICDREGKDNVMRWLLRITEHFDVVAQQALRRASQTYLEIKTKKLIDDLYGEK